jgi:hypothetical protein
MSESRHFPIVLDAFLLITLVTALVFSAGWGYSERWFAHFDLGLVQLNIPVGNFAFYGYWVLEKHVSWLLLLAAILASLVAAARHWTTPDNRSGIWRHLPHWPREMLPMAATVILLALVLFLFWNAYSLGQRTADHDFAGAQANHFCAHPFVRVVLKDPSRLPTVVPRVAEALEKGHYRLLIQSGGVLALFRNNAPDQPFKPRLLVPVGEIALMELSPVTPGCGPG